jgi:hypothetical protein
MTLEPNVLIAVFTFVEIPPGPPLLKGGKADDANHE